LISYLFWKAKRSHRHSSSCSPSPPPSSSLPQNPAGELYSAGSFTRTGAATSSDFDKLWHPMWASAMGPPPRRQMAPHGQPQVSELAS
jgi:hypothetical protein